MNILSLFDWISCGRLALERAGIQVDKYFASEIDKYAIQIAKKNYPDTIHIGSVTEVRWEDYKNIDMIIWGSPCQDLSIAKKDWKWLQWEKSSLFFEYVRLLKEVKPKYFLLENVASMKKADKEEITRILIEIYPDTQCYLINSALVSAQNRKRLYWTNIQWVEQPDDKNIMLKDILETNVDEKYIMNESRTNFILNRPKNYYCPIDPEKANTLRTNYGNASANEAYVSTIRVWQFNSGGQWDRVYSPEWKSISLSANGGGRGAKTGLYQIKLWNIYPKWWQAWNVYSSEWKSATLTHGGRWAADNCWLYEVAPIIRKLTPIECERLQTLPDNWTEGISNTQRYKAIWNGWTVDVIAHIFSYLI